MICSLLSIMTFILTLMSFDGNRFKESCILNILMPNAIATNDFKIS